MSHPLSPLQAYLFLRFSFSILSFTFLNEYMSNVPSELIHCFELQPWVKLLSTTASDVTSEEAFSDLRILRAMKELWNDKGIQEAVSQCHQFALHDNFQ